MEKRIKNKLDVQQIKFKSDIQKWILVCSVKFNQKSNENHYYRNENKLYRAYI